MFARLFDAILLILKPERPHILARLAAATKLALPNPSSEPKSNAWFTIIPLRLLPIGPLPMTPERRDAFIQIFTLLLAFVVAADVEFPRKRNLFIFV